MKYYRGVLTVGLKSPRERIIFTQGEDITSALDVAKKIRHSKWTSFDEIDRDQYIHGVQSRVY